MFKEELKIYILENFLFTDDQSELGDDDSFMEREIIDSTGILEVIEFIEERCDIKIDDEEMLPENLDSVNRVIAFVDRKKAA